MSSCASCNWALAIGLMLVVLAALGPLSGCELVADFDRSKLDSGAEGTLDATTDDDAGVGSVTTVVAVKVK